MEAVPDESHQSSIRYDIHSISVGRKNKKLSKAGTPIAHLQVADSMYVHHMSSGVETSTQAGEQYKEAKTLFQSASINLREWASNYFKFLENGPECD